MSRSVILPGFSNIQYIPRQKYQQLNVSCKEHEQFVLHVLNMVMRIMSIEKEDGEYHNLLATTVSRFFPIISRISDSKIDESITRLSKNIFSKLSSYYIDNMLNTLKPVGHDLDNILLGCEMLTTNPEWTSYARIVHLTLNEILESTQTLRGFMTKCVRKCDSKYINQLLKQGNHSYDKGWKYMISVYQRLTRIQKLSFNELSKCYLSDKSLENINRICTQFDNKYNPVLVKIYSEQSAKVTAKTQYYGYEKFKFNLLINSGPTSIISIENGYDCVLNNDQDIDFEQLAIYLNSTESDFENFQQLTSHIIIDQNGAPKIAKGKTRYLRTMESIIMAIYCLQLMTTSFSKQTNKSQSSFSRYFCKLMQLREKAVQCIMDLYEKGILFPSSGINMNLDNDIIWNKLLTDDEDNSTWIPFCLSALLLMHFKVVANVGSEKQNVKKKNVSDKEEMEIDAEDTESDNGVQLIDDHHKNVIQILADIFESIPKRTITCLTKAILNDVIGFKAVTNIKELSELNVLPENMKPKSVTKLKSIIEYIAFGYNMNGNQCLCFKMDIEICYRLIPTEEIVTRIQRLRFTNWMEKVQKQYQLKYGSKLNVTQRGENRRIHKSKYLNRSKLSIAVFHPDIIYKGINNNADAILEAKWRSRNENIKVASKKHKS